VCDLTLGGVVLARAFRPVFIRERELDDYPFLSLTSPGFLFLDIIPLLGLMSVAFSDLLLYAPWIALPWSSVEG